MAAGGGEEAGLGLGAGFAGFGEPGGEDDGGLGAAGAAVLDGLYGGLAG